VSAHIIPFPVTEPEEPDDDGPVCVFFQQRDYDAEQRAEQQAHREWILRMQRYGRLLQKRREWEEQADPWLQIIRLYPGRRSQP
jgi:hypothetical protein